MKDTAQTSSTPRKGIYHFEGFSTNFGTAIPDIAFDELMPLLSASEWKVLCYVMRRTFGFKKEADSISLSQICSGITKKNGEILDRGTGLSKQTVIASLKNLQERGIVICNHQSSPERGDLANTYTLRFRGVERDGSQMRRDCPPPAEPAGDGKTPVSKILTPPSLTSRHPRVQNLDTQEAALQETDLQPSIRSIDKNVGREEKKPVSQRSKTTSPQQSSTSRQKTISAKQSQARMARRGEGFTSLSSLLENRLVIPASELETTSRLPLSDTPVRPAKGARSVDTSVSGQTPLVRPASHLQGSGRATARIASLVRELGAEYGDSRHSANISQFGGLFARSGLPEDRFLDWMYQVRSELRDLARRHPDMRIKRPMAYFYTTLKARLGM